MPEKDFLNHVKGRLTNMLSLPLIDKTLSIFKKLIRSHEREKLIEICHRELDLAQERVDSGDVIQAVLIWQQKKQEMKKSRL